MDWPDGATSRESLRAVWKLPRLPVSFLYYGILHNLLEIISTHLVFKITLFAYFDIHLSNFFIFFKFVFFTRVV